MGEKGWRFANEGDKEADVPGEGVREGDVVNGAGFLREIYFGVEPEVSEFCGIAG